MGEFLRAVIEKNAVVSRPRWYSSVISWPNTLTPGTLRTEYLEIEASTGFLLMQIVTVGLATVTTSPNVRRSDQRVNWKFRVNRNQKDLQLTWSAPNDIGRGIAMQSHLPEYVYLRANETIQSTLQVFQNTAAQCRYYAMFSGIEYKFPGGFNDEEFTR